VLLLAVPPASKTRHPASLAEFVVFNAVEVEDFRWPPLHSSASSLHCVSRNGQAKWKPLGWPKLAPTAFQLDGRFAATPALSCISDRRISAEHEPQLISSWRFKDWMRQQSSEGLKHPVCCRGKS
jgi:hypothetical protein